MATELDRTFAALADPSRRQVIELLREQPLRSSEIADALALSRPAASRHLRVLHQAGLVSEQTGADDARARVYSLRRERLSELRGWIEEVESFWAEQLESFAAHAESQARGQTRGRGKKSGKGRRR